MTIQDIVSHFNTIPFLFVGSGITRRYYNLPDWKGLLTEFASRVNSDRFAYRAYESKAQQLGSTQGVMPKIATLIQQDFDTKWYNTPTMRTNESFVLNAVERGCSPFKAEIAWYLKEQSVALPEYKEELQKLKTSPRKILLVSSQPTMIFSLKNFLTIILLMLGKTNLFFLPYRVLLKFIRFMVPSPCRKLLLSMSVTTKFSTIKANTLQQS